MSSEGHYAELLDTLGNLLDLRRRFDELAPETPPLTAQQFYEALRARSPELPELSPASSKEGDEVSVTTFDSTNPTTYGCSDRAHLALMIENTATGKMEAGETEAAMFHP